MTETLAETGLQLIDKRIQDVADKLGELAEQYGPDVVDAGLMVVQIDAAQGLLIGISCLILGLISAKIHWWCWKAGKGKKSDEEIPYVVGGIATAFTSIIPLVGAGSYLWDIWTWVAIFEPKLAVAKRILDGVL